MRPKRAAKCAIKINLKCRNDKFAQRAVENKVKPSNISILKIVQNGPNTQRNTKRNLPGVPKKVYPSKSGSIQKQLA